MDADPKSPLQKGHSSAFHAAPCSSHSVVAERVGDKWAVSGWRLSEIIWVSHNPIAILTSQSASIAGKIMRKEVCALNIRVVGKNGNLEKINPYAI